MLANMLNVSVNLLLICVCIHMIGFSGARVLQPRALSSLSTEDQLCYKQLIKVQGYHAMCQTLIQNEIVHNTTTIQVIKTAPLQRTTTTVYSTLSSTMTKIVPSTSTSLTTSTSIAGTITKTSVLPSTIVDTTTVTPTSTSTSTSETTVFETVTVDVYQRRRVSASQQDLVKRQDVPQCTDDNLKDVCLYVLYGSTSAPPVTVKTTQTVAGSTTLVSVTKSTRTTTTTTLYPTSTVRRTRTEKSTTSTTVTLQPESTMTFTAPTFVSITTQPAITTSTVTVTSVLSSSSSSSEDATATPTSPDPTAPDQQDPCTCQPDACTIDNFSMFMDPDNAVCMAPNCNNLANDDRSSCMDCGETCGNAYDAALQTCIDKRYACYDCDPCQNMPPFSAVSTDCQACRDACNAQFTACETPAIQDRCDCQANCVNSFTVCSPAEDA